MNFYATIIGSEILNGRRVDKHFDFLRDLLHSHNHQLFASFVIKDDPHMMRSIYKLVRDDPKSVMFSFGGIGSTPDDLTRPIAAEVFTSKPLVRHPRFEADIIERFGDEAYPHRIHMSDLPAGSKLLFNPINNMSGFSLEDRFFFTPGFPQMSHPMITDVVASLFGSGKRIFRKTILAHTSENTLVSVMQEVSDMVEFSSLPILDESGVRVEISVASSDEMLVESEIAKFEAFLIREHIGYVYLA